MHIRYIALLIVLILTTVNAYARIDGAEAQRIIEDRCTQCHTSERLEVAMQRGDNFAEIMTKMIRLGARIDRNEQEVLGIFWSGQQRQNTGVISQGQTVVSDPLGGYRAVLERRCTGCHSLDIVEKAMQEGRSLDDLVVMMRQRGAVVTLQEKSVLDTFWGSPFRGDPSQ